MTKTMTNAERARELAKATAEQWWDDRSAAIDTDYSTVSYCDLGELIIRITSALDTIRRETVEECARVADAYVPDTPRPGRDDGYTYGCRRSTAEGIAAAIRALVKGEG